MGYEVFTFIEKLDKKTNQWNLCTDSEGRQAIYALGITAIQDCFLDNAFSGEGRVPLETLSAETRSLDMDWLDFVGFVTLDRFFANLDNPSAVEVCDFVPPECVQLFSKNEPKPFSVLEKHKSDPDFHKRGHKPVYFKGTNRDALWRFVDYIESVIEKDVPLKNYRALWCVD